MGVSTGAKFIISKSSIVSPVSKILTSPVTKTAPPLACHFLTTSRVQPVIDEPSTIIRRFTLSRNPFEISVESQSS